MKPSQELTIYTSEEVEKDSTEANLRDFQEKLYISEQVNTKYDAAILIERILSKNLASKFIDCWDTLKAVLNTRTKDDYVSIHHNTHKKKYNQHSV